MTVFLKSSVPFNHWEFTAIADIPNVLSGDRKGKSQISREKVDNHLEGWAKTIICN